MRSLNGPTISESRQPGIERGCPKIGCGTTSALSTVLAVVFGAPSYDLLNILVLAVKSFRLLGGPHPAVLSRTNRRSAALFRDSAAGRLCRRTRSGTLPSTTMDRNVRGLLHVLRALIFATRTCVPPKGSALLHRCQTRYAMLARYRFNRDFLRLSGNVLAA